jgi:hypothetical protein
MEFENFSSVKAKTRRSAPVVIGSSTWAFTFSTRAFGQHDRSGLGGVSGGSA